MASPVVDVGVSRRPSLFVKLLVGILASVALFAVYNTLSADESDEIVLQQTMPLPPRNSQSPLGTAGNKIDDGDQDAAEYDYDPLHGDDPFHKADTLPDIEGQAPPTPKWHACRFQAKQGGVYDLRPLMRLARTLEEDWVHRDAIHSKTTYFLNVCANTMAVPPACAKLAKKDSPQRTRSPTTGTAFTSGRSRHSSGSRSTQRSRQRAWYSSTPMGSGARTAGHARSNTRLPAVSTSPTVTGRWSSTSGTTAAITMSTGPTARVAPASPSSSGSGLSGAWT